MAIIDLPLGYRSGVQATGLINEYYKRFKPKELDEVKVLFLHAHGPGILHTKKPVAKLEDLKGMKIRAEETSFFAIKGSCCRLVKPIEDFPHSLCTDPGRTSFGYKAFGSKMMEKEHQEPLTRPVIICEEER